MATGVCEACSAPFQGRSDKRFCGRACKTRKRDAGRDSRAWHGHNIRRYGITLEQYDALAKDQGGVCAICAGSCPSGHRLAIDHDHATGRVRALLCARCNAGLGQFRDRPDLLREAARYLDHHKETG